MLARFSFGMLLLLFMLLGSSHNRYIKDNKLSWAKLIIYSSYSPSTAVANAYKANYSKDEKNGSSNYYKQPVIPLQDDWRMFIIIILWKKERESQHTQIKIQNIVYSLPPLPGCVVDEYWVVTEVVCAYQKPKKKICT